MGYKTALYDLHKAAGGKLVDFSGWHMPINYGSQIEEHHQVRRHAGLFDVSHMTVVDVTGPDARAYLRKLLANDVARLDHTYGKALYTAMLNHEGGVIDDLIIYHLKDWYRAVLNCATRDKDLAWMTEQAARFDVNIIERTELAIIAAQGPAAIELTQQVASDAQAKAISSLKVFCGVESKGWFIGRTGYTGEDGLEIMLNDTDACALWQALVTAGATPCGLGARDTLRLEAGMNLYGHEMDDTTSPLVANMGWTIALEDPKRDFIGREPIEAMRASSGPDTKLVGLVLRERGILRAGQSVNVAGNDAAGMITSGSFAPTLGFSVALARVPSTTGDSAEVNLRNKSVAVEVVKPGFVRHGDPLV